MRLLSRSSTPRPSNRISSRISWSCQLPLVLLASTLPAPSSAGNFDPAKDVECASPDSICLTSFRWCARDGVGGKGCSYPPGIDAFFPGSETVPYAMLYHGDKYDITWKQARPGVPVLIEWLFAPELYQDGHDAKAGGELQVMWSTNTTGSSYTFDPLAILMTFPTAAAPNMSTGQAIAATHAASNHIRISQPAAPSDGGSSTTNGITGLITSAAPRTKSVSDQFLVHSRWTREFVANVQAYDESLYGQQQRNWQIGIGAGIGIGLPLLVTLAWLAGHRLGSRAGYDLAEKATRRDFARREMGS